jgi:hypothetical protein
MVSEIFLYLAEENMIKVRSQTKPNQSRFLSDSGNCLFLAVPALIL